MKLNRIDRKLWLVFLIGLVIRLIFMPFTTHSDLLYTYWDAHMSVYHHQLVVFQAILQYLHAGYLWLITWLLPPADSIWIHLTDTPQLNPFTSLQVSSLQGWFDFIRSPQIYRILFLLKLPYLFFDLGCACLLYRFGTDRSSSRRIFAFWWLNPLVIFAGYIFGRHEVVTLFLIILSLYWTKKEKTLWGVLTLGLAIAARYYAVLLLPFFVLSIYPTWKKRFIGLLLGISPWLIINLLGWALSGSMDVQGLAGMPHNSYFLAMKFNIGPWDNLYIFPLVYCLLLLHRLYNQELGMRSLVQYSLVALLLLFATGYSGQSPHYWTWFLPLLAIAYLEDRRLLPLHIAQIIFLFGYSFVGGRATGGYLFAPISPEFFWSLPSPVEILQRFISPELPISLARTAFSAISIWMAFLVLRRIKTAFLMDAEQEGES